jgi:hypothetical protein
MVLSARKRLRSDCGDSITCSDCTVSSSGRGEEANGVEVDADSARCARTPHGRNRGALLWGFVSLMVRVHTGGAGGAALWQARCPERCAARRADPSIRHFSAPQTAAAAPASRGARCRASALGGTLRRGARAPGPPDHAAARTRGLRAGRLAGCCMLQQRRRCGRRRRRHLRPSTAAQGVWPWGEAMQPLRPCQLG